MHAAEQNGFCQAYLPVEVAEDPRITDASQRVREADIAERCRAQINRLTRSATDKVPASGINTTASLFFETPPRRNKIAGDGDNPDGIDEQASEDW